MHQVDHSKNIIEFKDISFAYGEKEVLRDVSFNIHQGDFLGVVGPNGGGKTTLLKIMLGLLPLQHGSVTLFGTQRAQFSDWSKIGYVPQKATSFDINFPATVEEIVMMGRYGKLGLFRFPSQQDTKAVTDALAKVGMCDERKTLIGNLSGGQQQRVFIARALVSEPEVIILDEPTVGVDAETQAAFYALLRQLNREFDLTLVLVSHDLDVVAEETTEVACINRGLVYHGASKAFSSGEHLVKAYGEHVKFVKHDH